MAPRQLLGSLLDAADALEASGDELNRLDGYAGDGDLGVTMSEVATVLRAVVAEAGDASTPKLLSSCGSSIARSAPSTSGTLVATGFLRAAKAAGEVSGPDEPAVEVISRCFRAATEGIQSRGKAALGDRTLVDGLDAVSTSLQLSSSEGLSWQEALQRAAEAAAAAAEATASMVPKAGRASWVPERALGHPDAGCTMLALVIRAVAAGALPGTAPRTEMV